MSWSAKSVSPQPSMAANLSRLPRYGNELWTRATPDAYNINVTPTEDIACFFGVHSLPKAQVPAEILDIQEVGGMVNEDNAMLISLLDAAMVPPTSASSEESVVIDFTVQLLRYLGGYVGRRRYPRTRKVMPGIVMTGTMLYQIPVTADLVYKVRHGLFHAQPVEVLVFHVPVQNRGGMKQLDNRHIILSCFEAFKAIVEIN